MKKIIIIFLTFNTYLSVSYSQNGWVQMAFGLAKPAKSVFFINENTGWITTSGSNGFTTLGSILKSTNGGISWTESMSGNIGFEGISFINDNTGWAIGNFGNDVGGRSSYIFKTTNGGINYFVQYQDSLFTLLIKLAVASENAIFALRQNGQLISTSNSGLNWINQIVYNSYSLVDMQFVNAQTGWILSGFNFVLRTTNSGINWQTIFYGGKFFPRCFHFIDQSTGWVIQGPSYKTTNGGTSWDYFSANGNIAPLDIVFVNSNSGWICGGNGIIQRTTDGGSNWISQISGGNYSTITINSMNFINQNTGWAVGWGTISPYVYLSLILKTTTGGITGFNPVSTEIPNQFSLSQNYPNPFNPSTKIRFEIPPSASVAQTFLSVYDILGKEIATLVKQQLKPGTYEIEWSAEGGASAYPSGVYFYTLKTSGFTETKRMILIK